MPAAVERCVNSLLSKWKSDPSSRPTPRKKGKDGKPQDAKSQAWAICQAAHKKSQAKSLEIMLEGGYGPTLIGAAATNRPYIPRLEETKITGDDENKKLVVHLANPGFFNHPTGAFTLNHAVFSTMIHNFDTEVAGQRAAYDCRHQPNLGAFGWFEKLWIEDGKLYGQVEPTPVGLEQIGNKMYLYSSMEFHRNYKRDDVKLDLEDATEDFCVLDLEENAYLLEPNENPEDDSPNDSEDDSMSDEERVQLEQELEQEREKREAEEARVKALEKERDSAMERALQLEQEAVDSSVASVIDLAKGHRDKDGNALPRTVIEWVGKVLKFEEFGEDDDVVKLSEEEKPSMEMVKYLTSAVKHLILSMPGTVPTGKKSKTGESEKDDGFDFETVWDDVSKGDE